MITFQNWLFHTLAATHFSKEIMTSKWGWPLCETIHFLGLSMLVGAVMAKRVPIGALHRLIPWGISGYIITFLTGIMFLATEPDQYIYNPAFLWKVSFMLIAGLNVATFYLVMFRRVKWLGAGESAAMPARVIGALSLFLWIGVIVFGRMLTFYRPPPCDSPHTIVLTCIPPP
jgi:hypothetical protein